MRRAIGAVLLLLMAAACTDAEEDPPAAPSLEWTETSLSMPGGQAGRVAVRDAARCGEQWYVVGAVFAGPGESRPAAWRSADGQAWTALVMRPRSYWARRNVIYSVACRSGEVAMIGAKEGGAHGNPRVSTWRQLADGSFESVTAPFELYGGPHAVNVGRLVAGPPGWLIVGNRFSGAAVWTSPDARAFRLVDDDPALRRDAELDTFAVDATYAAGGAWTVVGGAQRQGRVPRVPMAWVSTDGVAWRRVKVPYDEEFAELQRVTPIADGQLAVGVKGSRFGTWRETGGRWRSGPVFGHIDDDITAAPFVSALAVADRLVLASASDGRQYALWGSPDAGAHWSMLDTPVQPETAGEQVLIARISGDEVLLLADDAKSGRVWQAAVPG
ncbi:hypothetical protein [Nocardioides speluncae]|uniref:hypothetical protein n=1 Tax=Nocardioides speluncae TaxID=2670337 RepID=UPI000D68A562|nr:hypothetical protein [Nocardioides speluncae]